MKNFIKLLIIFLVLIFPKVSNAEILSGGIKIDHIASYGPELIRYSALGETSLVEKLLINHADPDQKFMKITASFVAIYKNYPDILELLLKYGADPDMNYMGETLLGFSIYRGSDECSNILILYGADINLKSLNKTPLYLALKKKNTKMAKILYSKGAQVDKSSKKIIKKLSLSFE